MCSQLAAICHIVFSSVVMGPVSPPDMGKEHDISAWLFSWLNLPVESTTHIESVCVGVCVVWDHTCESNKYVHLRFPAFGLFNLHVAYQIQWLTNIGSTAVLKMNVTHNLLDVHFLCFIVLCVFVTLSFFWDDVWRSIKQRWMEKGLLKPPASSQSPLP